MRLFFLVFFLVFGAAVFKLSGGKQHSCQQQKKFDLSLDIVERKVKDSLFCDVEDSVADVVCRCLPVSVDEAAAPAVL